MLEGNKEEFGNQKFKKKDESRGTIRLREEKEKKEKGTQDKKKQERKKLEFGKEII